MPDKSGGNADTGVLDSPERCDMLVIRVGGKDARRTIGSGKAEQS
jgi:hypothetical protein